MKAVLWVTLALIVVLLAAGGKFAETRTQLMSEQEVVAAQWVRVDAVLDSRAGLIPNLVNIVKGFARDETEAFRSIANAHAALAGARTPQEKIQANQQLDDALARLLVITENYPKLRSNESFLRLQDEIAATENRIAVERRKYNEALERYNTSIELFPNNVVASLSRFARNDAYFKTEPGPGGAPAAPKGRF